MLELCFASDDARSSAPLTLISFFERSNIATSHFPTLKLSTRDKIPPSPKAHFFRESLQTAFVDISFPNDVHASEPKGFSLAFRSIDEDLLFPPSPPIRHFVNACIPSTLISHSEISNISNSLNGISLLMQAAEHIFIIPSSPIERFRYSSIRLILLGPNAIPKASAPTDVMFLKPKSILSKDPPFAASSAEQNDSTPSSFMFSSPIAI
mmetsp:Transcript_26317/g.40216  ORF Transcript_26317/g.40216 Transcript_26317/m.40216 type:complete len:209 (+) Transcript_26317:568-1194(+)